MSKAITLRDELIEALDEIKNKENSGKNYTDKGYVAYSDVVKMLLEPLQEAEITADGRVSIGKNFAGKRIAYKVMV